MKKKSYTQPKMQILGAIADKTKTKGAAVRQDNSASAGSAGAQYGS